MYARLAADPALTSLTPGGVHHRQAPRDAAYPLVIFNRQAGTPWWRFGGEHIQNDLWLAKAVDRSSSAAAAEQIATTIDQALTDAPLDVDGYLLAVYRESDVDYGEVDGGDLVHHVGAQYRLLHQPA